MYIIKISADFLSADIMNIICPEAFETSLFQIRCSGSRFPGMLISH